MPEKIQPSLEGVSETLLITLYARARESQRPAPLIKDDTAVAMVQQIDCDYRRLRLQRHDEIAIIMRMKKFDEYVRKFIEANPVSVVVHIGCGLDTRFERVDNGRVEWFDLDMPDVIALRNRLIPQPGSRVHQIPSSVFEDGWLEVLSPFRTRPILFLAEGVLPYFEESLVKSLFLKLRDHFPGCELVCDAHTPFVLWTDNLQFQITGVKARLHWGLKNSRDVENWGEGIRLLDEWNYYQDDDSPLKGFRWVRLIPPLAKSSGIYYYRLGIR